MQTFQEYHAVRQLADLCEATGESPEVVLNEFLGFLRKWFGGGRQREQPPEMIPAPRQTGVAMRPDDRGMPLLGRKDVARFQRGEGHAADILKSLHDGFQRVVGEVGQRYGARFGEKAQPFFAELQSAVSNFVNKTLDQRLRLQLGGDIGRVKLRDPGLQRQARGGQWAQADAGMEPTRASSRRGR